MKYLDRNINLGEAECSADAVKPSELLLARLTELDQILATGLQQPAERIKALLDRAYILLDLERNPEGWVPAREAFELAAANESWAEAVQACDVMSQTDHPEAVKALAHGVWLGVTYPIDPELSVAILQRLVEETPPEADGAAVAAAAARYVVELRAENKQREQLSFFTGQMLGNVARQHSGVDSQELFDFWMERMQLDDPATVLSRLARMLDVLVPNEWWVDRDALRAGLPD